MKLRIYLLVVIAAFFTLTTNAQVFVSKRFVWKVKEFDKGEYELIKGKKTIFVLDNLDRDKLESMLKDTWTYNEYEVIDTQTYNANFEKYVTENNAIFKFFGYVSNSYTTTASDPTGTNHTNSYTHMYLHYFYPSKLKIKKDKVVDFKVNEVAAIFLNANTGELTNLVGGSTNANLDAYTNYKIGYLKNCFQNIINILNNKGTAFAYDNTVDATKIKNLQEATLYVPEYIKTSHINLGGTENKEDGDNLFKDYPYKYEFIADDVLNNKILAGGKESFYYLTFVRLSGQKIIVVTDGLTGDIIYNEYVAMTYNLKAKDLARIAEKAAKGK